MRRTFLALGAALSLVGASAGAQTVLLNEPFSGTSSVLNFNGFSNFDVVAGTTVDLIRSGDFGITCAGGAGYCVDLSGSSGATSNGNMQTQLAYGFSAGDVMTFQLDFSGNQRNGAPDSFAMFVSFLTPTSVSTLTHAIGNNVIQLGAFAPVPDNSTSISTSGIASTDPFRTWSISFTAASAGSARLGFFTTTTDNIGPIVDNVRITRSSAAVGVPEPMSLALLGAGLLGLGYRRTRSRRS